MKETTLSHYIEKYKEHEARRATTNERNAYWQLRQERENYAPRSATRFEHG